MHASGILEFNHGVALTFDCGMWAAGRNVLEVIGSEGRIEVPSAFVVQQDNEDNFFVVTKAGRREVEVPKLNQYALQADVLGRSIRSGEPLPYPSNDAVLNMKVLDACLTSARKQQRVEIK